MKAFIRIMVAFLSLHNSAWAKDASSTGSWLLLSSYDQLDNGSPDWWEHLLEYETPLSSDIRLAGVLTHTERFGLTDQGLALRGKLIRQGITVVLEAGTSPDHQFTPEQYIAGDLYFPNGATVWSSGVRRSSYSNDTTTVLRAGFEHYVSSWMLSYTLAHGHLHQGPTGLSHDPRATYFWTDRSSLAVGYVFGEEATRLTASQTELTDVSGPYLRAKLGLSKSWTLLLNAHQIEQGDFYTRTGLAIGLAYQL